MEFEIKSTKTDFNPFHETSFPESISERTSNSESHWDKFKDTTQKVASFIKDVLWKYLKEAANITKRVIKVVSLVVSDISAKLTPIISKIGIMSGISILFALEAIYGAGVSLANNAHLKDDEGIFWSTLGLIINPLDALDSIITTTDALVAFGAFPAVAAFGLIALPIGITLSSFAAVKGLYDLIQNSVHYAQIPKELQMDNLEEYKTYLKSKIGITKEEKLELAKTLEIQKSDLSEAEFEKLKSKEIQIIKDRKKNIISRHTDAKIYNIMTHILKGLKEANPDLGNLNLALDDMKTIMVRKITWGSINSVANIAFSTALAASAAFAISPFAIPIIAGVRALVQVGKHHYDHVWLHHGLNLPSFANEAEKL